MARDLACAAILLSIAILYYGAARGLGATALSDTVGPAGLPVVYAAALAILAVLLAAATLIRKLRPAGGDSAAGIGRKVLRAAGALLIGIAYLGIVPGIGYPFAIAAAIAAMALYQGERPSLHLALVACVGAAMLYGLFDLVLGVPMPAPWSG
ncbi:MAG: tripartite tricarboxylate transporter TctB family protein [Gammaproteobacteria bacterium]|jgi:hypothetical protein